MIALDERRVGLQTAVIAGGVAILILRPLVGWTTLSIAVLFGGLLVVAMAIPVAVDHDHRRPITSTGLTVLVAGVAIFAAARLLGGGHSPAFLSAHVVILNSLAAVAEEALFRRLAFSALLPGGAAWAVAGSALLFGLVHVTVYGWWALPIDLAAGLILSWQRLASGTWAIPAMTHVLADLLVVI
jgi:hypothetical protein